MQTFLEYNNEEKLKADLKVLWRELYRICSEAWVKFDYAVQNLDPRDHEHYLRKVPATANSYYWIKNDVNTISDFNKKVESNNIGKANEYFFKGASEVRHFFSRMKDFILVVEADNLKNIKQVEELSRKQEIITGKIYTLLRNTGKIDESVKF